eukprot:m.118963 g.118963  ORF g.118963 m.118963 type:complete len:539 (-) comp16448_c0_seq3:185-1801(-)
MMSSAAAVVLAVVVAVATAAAPKKLNILFIVSDDLGYADLGYTGSSIKTPHIDGLANNGTVLGHYYVMQCCSPTRSALHTGRYNIRYGLQTNVIPNNKEYGLNLTETLLPQYMKKLGYQTHAIGKWHLGLYRWAYTPTFRGYDSFLGYYSGSQDYYTHVDSGIDLHLDDRPNCGPNCSVPLIDMKNIYSTHIYSARAQTVIQNHDESKGPLFLYMPFQSVHCPIQAPASYVEPYAHLDPNRQTFAGMLAALDEAVGQVIDALKIKGIFDDTLVVFSTDNGGPVGSLNDHPRGIGCATGSQNYPLRGGKGSYFQGGVRGTGFVYGPKFLDPQLAGKETYELMHVTDWLPTLVAAANGGKPLAWDKPLDGVNQWPTLSAGAPSARSQLLINIERKGATTGPCRPGPGITCPHCNGIGEYAVMVGHHKLLYGTGGQPNTWFHDDAPYNGTDPVTEGGCIAACTAPSPTGCPATPLVQVYDVFADPEERNNLAPGNPALVKQLMEVVVQYNTSEYVDALPLNLPVENKCPYNDENHVLTPCP